MSWKTLDEKYKHQTQYYVNKYKNKTYIANVYYKYEKIFAKEKKKQFPSTPAMNANIQTQYHSRQHPELCPQVNTRLC